MTVKEIDEDWSIFAPTISRDSSLPPYAVLSVVSKRKTKDAHLLGHPGNRHTKVAGNER
jgi:hypothetical protein